MADTQASVDGPASPLCTFPPTRILFGVTGFGASFTGGGGGAAEGTEPMIPPMTPPGAPPGTPPGTPPTTPALATGGISSSLIIAMSFGICFGAVSLPGVKLAGTPF